MKEKTSLFEHICEFYGDPLEKIGDILSSIVPETKEEKITWLIVMVATLGLPIFIIAELIIGSLLIWVCTIPFFIIFYPLIEFIADLFDI